MHTCERLGTGRSCSILHTRPAVRACSAVSNLMPYWTGKTSCCRGGGRNTLLWNHQVSHNLPRRHTSSNPQPKGHISSWLLFSSRGSSTHLKEKFPLCRVFQQVLDQHHKVGLRFLDLGVLLSYTQTQKKVYCNGYWINKRARSSNASHSYQCGCRDFQSVYEGLNGSGIWQPLFVKQIQDDLEKNKTTAKSWKLPQNLNVCF